MVEQKLTMHEMDNNSREYIKSRAELSCTSNDWEKTWTRLRLNGLGSAATSFLWKLLHQLLTTEYRLSRILPNRTPDCKLCPGHVQADLVHCFFHCDTNNPQVVFDLIEHCHLRKEGGWGGVDGESLPPCYLQLCVPQV